MSTYEEMYARHEAERKARRWEDARRTKRLRERINREGFCAVLKSIGADTIKRADQMRILRQVEQLAQFIRKEPRKPRDPLISKLERLASCPGATESERAAARQAMARLENKA
jgi:hypothetical protein